MSARTNPPSPYADSPGRGRLLLPVPLRGDRPGRQPARRRPARTWPRSTRTFGGPPLGAAGDLFRARRDGRRQHVGDHRQRGPRGEPEQRGRPASRRASWRAPSTPVTPPPPRRRPALVIAYNNAAGRTPGSSASLVTRTGRPSRPASTTRRGVRADRNHDAGRRRRPERGLHLPDRRCAEHRPRPATIILINGAQASNVFWQVNGAVGTGADSSSPARSWPRARSRSATGRS